MTPTSEPTLLAYLADLHERDYAEFSHLVGQLAPILLGVPGGLHRAVMHATREGALSELIATVARYEADCARIDRQAEEDERAACAAGGLPTPPAGWRP